MSKNVLFFCLFGREFAFNGVACFG